MTRINDIYRTLGEWEEQLTPYEMQCLRDMGMNEETPYSAHEVMDNIIRYNGGMASGWEVRALIRSVFDIEL